MRDRDAAMVEAYENHGATVDELGQEYGISTVRVRAILRAARDAQADDRRAPVATAAVVVDGELVDGPRPRTWVTQAERDRAIDNADEVFATMSRALAPNTREAYKAQWKRFLKWCRDHQRTPLPVSRETLLSYLKDMRRDDLS